MQHNALGILGATPWQRPGRSAGALRAALDRCGSVGSACGKDMGRQLIGPHSEGLHRPSAHQHQLARFRLSAAPPQAIQVHPAGQCLSPITLPAPAERVNSGRVFPRGQPCHPLPAQIQNRQFHLTRRWQRKADHGLAVEGIRVVGGSRNSAGCSSSLPAISARLGSQQRSPNGVEVIDFVAGVGVDDDPVPRLPHGHRVSLPACGQSWCRKVEALCRSINRSPHWLHGAFQELSTWGRRRLGAPGSAPRRGAACRRTRCGAH